MTLAAGMFGVVCGYLWFLDVRGLAHAGAALRAGTRQSGAPILPSTLQGGISASCCRKRISAHHHRLTGSDSGSSACARPNPRRDGCSTITPPPGAARTFAPQRGPARTRAARFRSRASGAAPCATFGSRARRSRTCKPRRRRRRRMRCIRRSRRLGRGSRCHPCARPDLHRQRGRGRHRPRYTRRLRHTPTCRCASARRGAAIVRPFLDDALVAGVYMVPGLHTGEPCVGGRRGGATS